MREKRKEYAEIGAKSVVLLALAYADKHCLAHAFVFVTFHSLYF